MNLFKMMKEASSMQKEMKRIQKELEGTLVEQKSRDGLVKAVVRCDMTLKHLSIDAKLVDASRVSRLEETVVSTVNAALAEAREKAGKEMSKLTAGMNIPGLG